MKTITVLGGLGYIGSHLCEILLNQGYKVVNLDIELFGWKHCKLFEHENFIHIRGDARSSADLAVAIRDSDIVVNLAGLVGDPACSLNLDETWLHNVVSSNTIAEVCDYFNVERLIYASSCSVYGAAPSDITLNEGSYLNPVSLYARTKIKSEEIFLEKFSGIASIIRLATVFGYSERMRFDLVVNGFTIRALKGLPIEVYGGNQFRPFIHCFDAARAFLALVEEKEVKHIDNEIFNICAENISIVNLARKVKEIVGGDIKFVNVKEDDRNYQVSSEKARWLLDYEPVYDLEIGIKDMVENLKDKVYDDWEKNDLYYNHKVC